MSEVTSIAIADLSVDEQQKWQNLLEALQALDIGFDCTQKRFSINFDVPTEPSETSAVSLLNGLLNSSGLGQGLAEARESLANIRSMEMTTTMNLARCPEIDFPFGNVSANCMVVTTRDGRTIVICR